MSVSANRKEPAQAPRIKSMPSFENVDGTFVERTKAGTISRMRSHNGNKPMIPQNHRCTICPAKFTRVTHLQRHMRTHSDQRQYTCDRCSGQFTRSDLLTRHKRTCGDPNHAQKSRRRACQACVEGKAKCDLSQPCARCSAKQWPCLYDKQHTKSPSPPGSSSLRRAISEAHDSRASRSPPTAGPSQPPLPPYVEMGRSVSLSQLSEDPDLHLLQNVDDFPGPSSSTGTFHGYRDYPHGLPVSSSYAPSSYATESLYDGESSIYSGGLGDNQSQSVGPSLHAHPSGNRGSSFGQLAQSMTSTINTLLSDDLLQRHYWNVIEKDNCVPAASTPYVAGPGPSQSPGADPYLSAMPWVTGQLDMQPFMAEMPPFGFDPATAMQALMGISEYASQPAAPAVPNPAVEPTFIPYPSEFQQYMHLFYNMFLTQMPVMHVATFTIDNKPPVLISAMQACGALYARTPGAAKFIDEVLSTTRMEAITEFEKYAHEPDMQMYFIIAVVLLQTIGLFHQLPEERSRSILYHPQLVAMVKRSGSIRRISEWVPPSTEDITVGEVVWHRWAFHETTKRALLLSYLHDTCHSIYFTVSPSFAAGEMTVSLPCEDAIWQANSYEEWRGLLRRSSPYGSRNDRLRPAGLQAALQKLLVPADPSPPSPHEMPAVPLLVTPFAHFILSHAILRKLFTECMSDRSETQDEEAYAVQVMLSNWLQSWFKSPETPHASSAEPDPDPVFLHDALPFYWIAQIALLAHREDLLPFGAERDRDRDRSGEAKYALMKEWLRIIREHLRKGEEEPTLFWDQMMKIHMRNRSEGRTSPNGLLGFFAD